MATYVLHTESSNPPSASRAIEEGIGSAELIRSMQWYARVRWIAAGIFAIAGVALLDGLGVGRQLGVRPLSGAMWRLAVFLAVGNLPFWIAGRQKKNPLSRRAAKLLLWGQILLDLLAVTYLVHVVGSVDTFVAFFYLLHITLSCISLSRSESLVVALLSSLLYLGTVSLEATGVWSARPVFNVHLTQAQGLLGSLVFALSAVFLWFVIWYFISTLSQSLRRSESEIRRANARLRAADEEKNRIMIQTTHDLKTPFFGIESNIQLLAEQAGRELPDGASRAMNRIRSQAKTLRARIDSILLYNELRSDARHAADDTDAVDLVEVANEVVEEARARAQGRRVSIETQLVPVAVRGSRRQLSALLSNLVSNAVAYSREDGKIVVAVREAGPEIVVSVRDDGIGIRDDALPHIFDEYFRAKEAVRINRMSTGLGLAIVREIALRNSFRVRVTSTEGEGTAFEVTIPRPQRSTSP